MQEAVPVGEGAMAAIIGWSRRCRSRLRRGRAQGSGTVCQVANDNGGGQVVISGDKAAVERAIEAATEKGAKRALLLPVSAPFHSPLMPPAADAMHEALAGVTSRRRSVPVVANVPAARSPIRPRSPPPGAAGDRHGALARKGRNGSAPTASTTLRRDRRRQGAVRACQAHHRDIATSPSARRRCRGTPAGLDSRHGEHRAVLG